MQQLRRERRAFHQGTTVQDASANACEHAPAPSCPSVVSPDATGEHVGLLSCSAQLLPASHPVACATTSMRPPRRPARTVSTVSVCSTTVNGTAPSIATSCQLTAAFARNVVVPLLKHCPKVGVITSLDAPSGCASPSIEPVSGRLAACGCASHRRATSAASTSAAVARRRMPMRETDASKQGRQGREQIRGSGDDN